MVSILKDYQRYFKSISRNISLYYNILLISAITSSAFNILLGIYLKNLGQSEAFVGGVLSLMTLGVGIGAFPVTMIADRFSKKKTIFFGLIIMIFAGLGMINITYLPLVQVSAFVFGLGQAAVMILQAPILYENTPEPDRVTAFSMAFVLQNFSFVVSSFFLGHASSLLSARTNEILGNQYVLNASTLLLLIPLISTLKFSGESMMKSSRVISVKETIFDTLKGYRNVLKGESLQYVIQASLIGFGAGMIVPFFSIYLKFMLSINDGVVGTIMAISQVGTILGGLIVAPLANRIGRVKTVLICQLLSIPFLLSISFPQGIVMITVAFFFRSSLMNMAGPIISSLSMDIVSDEIRTHMSSVVSMTNHLFRALGIFVGGYIMYNVSYNTPYYFTIVCYLIGTAIFYNIFKGRD